MRWSISAARVFAQCPRKWYYNTIFADRKSPNPLRQEADILSRLNSIHAWRGKLVDQVISTFVVPRFNRGTWVSLDAAINHAEWLMNKQLAFGLSNSHRNNGGVGTDGNSCAFFELEYGGTLTADTIENAKNEIRASLTNLYNSNLMAEIRKNAVKLVAQRPLQFPFAGVTVMGTPDLIAFFKDHPPHIVDWKVEAPTYKEHWLQLGSYGVALSRVKPHSDFPEQWHETLKDPVNIDLTEFQLLRNKEQEYHMTPEDVVDIEDYIYTSIERMQLLTNGRKLNELNIDDFPTAKSPETCMRCNFRKICWKEASQ